jgi:aspartyl-tRNA(Asn)/glutamyl-tRNA(Gln) amidotransferase subunit C
MALTLEEVRKIATLARLRFTPEEESVFVGQLGAIVDYIDQLQTYPSVEEGRPDLEAREAEDRPHECLPRELFLANAPAAQDGFLLVPEVKGGGREDG